ncbi:SCO family protein [Rhizobium sp. FKL33]|uniref:SCO family protein n=1 Tax=Rhizobium sp. FKL33 TaxID=2562307 RepID=UPI0010C0ECB4|nr:SCO family protein [Rhizobium sp. FKL33]
MTKTNPFLIVVLAVVGLFMSALIGIIAWVAADDYRPGPFRETFTLINDRGETVTEKMFRGRPSLVYFGYTHCPEVCPTTLYDVSVWLKKLGPEGAGLQVYFITIDPERDTQQLLHGYVNAFTDRITGITGDPKEIRKVVDGWMIHASKSASKNGDYHMSHTTSLLLIGSDARLKYLLPYGTEDSVAVDRIRDFLKRDRRAAEANS